MRDICSKHPKLRNMRAIVTILFIMLQCHVIAQTPLSFHDAMALAIENNKMLRSKQSDVTTAYYELQATRGLYYPKVELIGSYILTQRDMDISISSKDGMIERGANALINHGIANGILSPTIGDMLQTLLSPLRDLDLRYTLQKRSLGVVAAKLTLPLYAGGRIRAANRAAALKLGIAENELDAEYSNLHTTLVERYYGVVVLEYAVCVRREAVDAVARHLSDAQAMEGAGIIAHSAVLEVEYRLAEVKRELAHEENRLSMAKRALRTTMGINYDIETIDRLFINSSTLSIDYYINSAVNLNTTLSSAQLGIELANEGVVAARANLLPTVGIVGAGLLYDYQLSGILPRWAIGIEANITLFDGLAKERNLQAAKSRVESVKQTVENGRDEIILLTENEYYNMCNAIADIEALQSAITAAKSYYQSALDGFHAEIVSATEVIDAEVAVAASQLELLNAVYNYCTSLARLLEVSGLSDTFDTYRDTGIVLNIENGLINQTYYNEN